MQLILKNQSSTIGGETNSSFDSGNLMNNGQSQQYKSKWNLRPVNQLTRWWTSTAALLIFVTTITSVGCVKNLAKCKFPIRTQKPALHPVLSRIYALSSVEFLGLKLRLCKKWQIWDVQQLQIPPLLWCQQVSKRMMNQQRPTAINIFRNAQTVFLQVAYIIYVEMHLKW